MLCLYFCPAYTFVAGVTLALGLTSASVTCRINTWSGTFCLGLINVVESTRNKLFFPFFKSVRRGYC